jgi:hypothetical protein
MRKENSASVAEFAWPFGSVRIDDRVRRQADLCVGRKKPGERHARGSAGDTRGGIER